jgi:hypothetical protein
VPSESNEFSTELKLSYYCSIIERAEMRINVEWLDKDKHILHIVFHANWNWNDYREHCKQVAALVHPMSYNIAALMEYDKDAQFLPAHALRHLSIAVQEVENNIVMLILVAPSRWWRVTALLLQRALPNSILRNMSFVSTREQGLALITNSLLEAQH